MPASNSDEGSSNRIQSVETAFNIIRELQASEGCSVSELADNLELPKSTAHVYLQTLKDEGYVVKEDDVYRLGLRFLEHGGHRRQRMNIYQVARPAIDELSRETGEVATLGIEEGGKRVLVYSSEPPEGVFDNSPTGQFTHMHWTSLGKSMLAHLPPERVETIIDEHGLPKATEQTITDRQTLLDELGTINQRGYSIEDEERREGIKAIGVPVRVAETNEGIAAVSVSGPKNRIDRKFDESSLVEMIRSTVNVIELQFQHY